MISLGILGVRRLCGLKHNSPLLGSRGFRTQVTLDHSVSHGGGHGRMLVSNHKTPARKGTFRVWVQECHPFYVLDLIPSPIPWAERASPNSLKILTSEQSLVNFTMTRYCLGKWWGKKIVLPDFWERMDTNLYSVVYHRSHALLIRKPLV